MITNDWHMEVEYRPSEWFDLVAGPACKACFQFAFFCLPK
jgi:hypothetical protein